MFSPIVNSFIATVKGLVMRKVKRKIRSGVQVFLTHRQGALSTRSHFSIRHK